MSTRERGFTLIEVMVVIFIIGVLSSVIISTISSAHAKSNDAKRISDMHTIALDLQRYTERFNAAPANQIPNSGYFSNQPNFLHELVDNGYLPALPQPPDNAGADPYGYYDYGQGGTTGMLIETQLEAAPAGTGYANTCRPFPDLGPASNWCNQGSNTYYCICIPY